MVFQSLFTVMAKLPTIQIKGKRDGFGSLWQWFQPMLK